MHLVFVHIPKTAGTSLRDTIADRVGTQNASYILATPGAKSWLHRNAKAVLGSWLGSPPRHRVLFGHFVAGRYGRFNGWTFSRRHDCRYVTMLREPLQRALSHFHFWKRTKVEGHRVWERFIREDWSLERFLFAREILNLQSVFLWRFPLRRFDAVLVAERYADSLRLLGATFPELAGLPVAVANANPERTADGSYAIDPRLATAFRQAHAEDCALYAEGVRLFERQIAALGQAGA